VSDARGRADAGRERPGAVGYRFRLGGQSNGDVSDA